MLTTADYDLLVLRGFEALRREIEEAEQYTAQHYQQLVAQQKAKAQAQEQSKEQAEKSKTTATSKTVK